MFETEGRAFCEETALNDKRLPMADPQFGASLPQSMGLRPLDEPQLQARLHPLILAQSRDHALPALFKVVSMSAPGKSYTTIKQSPNETFMAFLLQFAHM